jgi:hypothetical protein
MRLPESAEQPLQSGPKTGINLVNVQKPTARGKARHFLSYNLTVVQYWNQPVTMRRTNFMATSRRIETEKTVKRIGMASIKLDILDFPHSKNLNSENVDRLERLFRGERGCLPDNLLNHIPAIISENQLQQALTFSRVSSYSLLSDSEKPVRLEFPPGFRLECLRGRHRVRAADEVLTSTDKRWFIDLYRAGR